MNRVIREQEREQLTGVKRRTWDRWEHKDMVPKRLRLGPNSVGWYLHEIEDFLKSTRSANA